MWYKWILLLAGFGLLVHGGQDVYEGVTHRAPTRMTMDQFLREKPNEGWFHLQGCFLDVADGSVQTESGEVTSVYVPVYSVNDPKQDAIHLLLSTNDPQILSTIAEAAKQPARMTPAQTLAYAFKNKNRLWVKRDVEGMIQFGLDSDDKTNGKLTDINKTLAPDWVILEDGKKPAPGLGALEMLGGLALGAGAIFLLTRKKPPLPFVPMPPPSGYGPPPSNYPPPSSPPPASGL